MHRRFDNLLQESGPANSGSIHSTEQLVLRSLLNDRTRVGNRMAADSNRCASARGSEFGRADEIADCVTAGPDRNLLSDEQFLFFQDFARRFAGIVIADFKNSMVARRVRNRVKSLSLESIDNYIDYLHGAGGQRELQQLVNALTTNKTEFFREAHHFQHLGGDALKLLEKARGCTVKRMRVWSAGCSTGEEPYSIAMTLHSAMVSRINTDVRILATDIDTNVLSSGRAGRYNLSDISSVPQNFRSSFFAPVAGEPRKLQVSPKLRDMISFQHLNLHDPWSMKGPFDVIFCRNVVIYFDKPTQRRLFDRLADILTEGGLLYCGHSESLYGVSSRFRAIGQSIYQRLS